jgi:lipopolysaccharide export system permease protein
LDELTTTELLSPTPALLAETGEDEAAFRSDGHNRFAQPLLAPAAAMVGFACLLLGAFSRFGLWRQITGAVILLIAIQTINNAAGSASLRNASLWPLVYIAPLAGILGATLLLWVSQLPRRRTSGTRAVA